MFAWISDRLASTDETIGALGSASAARSLIARLQTETAQYALDEIAKQLHAAPREVLVTQKSSRALQELDEWAQAALKELSESVLGDNQGQTVREAVWASLARYNRRSFVAHWHALGLATATGMPQKADALKSAARAMAAFHSYMLIQRMRYLPVAEESWTHVWRLIGWAEQQGVAATPIEPYAGRATTVAQEFLIALLIEVAPTGNLLPGQILALDRVLRAHAEGYRILDRFDPHRAPFCYDPSRSQPPQRYVSGLKVPAGMRFFGPGIAYASFCKAHEDAYFWRNFPQWLGQSGCRNDGYAELLDLLVAHWSPEPPRRRHPRESRTGDLLVAHDLPTIRRLLKFSELAAAGQSLAYDAGDIYKAKSSLRAQIDGAQAGAKTVTAKEALANLLSFEKSLDPGTTEIWKLVDSSECGLGAIVEVDCTWVKIGMVVAFRCSDSCDWQLATIRRLSRSAGSGVCIGLARLSGKVRSARLRRGIAAVDYSKSGGAGEIEYDAISIKEATTSLLLPVGVFDNTQKYTLVCEDRQQIVRMEKTLERRPNFECVQISEVEMLQAA